MPVSEKMIQTIARSLREGANLKIQLAPGLEPVGVAGVKFIGKKEMVLWAKPAAAEQQAAQLAFFLANMGVIDTAGGAEWFGRGWTQEDLLKAFDEAGREAAGRCTEYLWEMTQ